MSLLLTRRGNGFEGVAAGQPAVSKLPIGLSFHRILVPYSGTGVVDADFKEIRLVANGEPFQTYVGGDKFSNMMKFDRITPTAGVLEIYVGDRPGMMTRAGIEFTKVGTGIGFDAKVNPFPITTLSLEIDIASDAPVDLKLSPPKLIQSERDVTGIVKKVKKFNYSPQGAGEFQISDLPRGDLINRIFFHTDQINAIKVERDGAEIFTRTTAENEHIQKNGKRTPQAGLFVIDPTELGYGSEAIVTRGVGDLRFYLDMAAAASFDVWVEYLGTISA
jgi:hypothetical protein